MTRKIIFYCLALLLFSIPASAAGWRLIDMGVGIYDDSEYDTKLKILEKGDTWFQKDLYERGAFSGRGKVFGAWLVGPPANTYLNANGIPMYGYKYRLTDPKGNATLSGPHSFYMPGFTTVFINASGPTGTWKIDFLLWSRETGQDSPIGSLQFQMTDKPVSSAAPGWRLVDAGIGIYDDSEYDTKLKILEKGDTWSQKGLYERGAFAGRGKVFGAWLVGPPVNTYLNANGVAKYAYKVRLTDPKGNATLSGPHGFYMPGFTTVFINAGGPTGTWKVDFLLWSRETGQDTPIRSLSFTITP
ncbi:MAG: hypothetical protein AB1427_01845 [Thermodesulfobacteriota bacterium]